MNKNRWLIVMLFGLMLMSLSVAAGEHASAGVSAMAAGKDTKGVLPTATNSYGWQIWQRDVVDMPGFFDAMSDRSLRFDSSGKLHMVYGGDRLYYATFDGAEWQSEIVDHDVGTGTGASIDLDDVDQPHISYLDLPNVNLKYAYWDGDSWTLQVVDKAYPYQERTSIAVDANGRPHIAYRKFEWLPPDYNCPGMGYALWTGSQWQIDRFNDCGGFASMALDSDGEPHITFNDDGINYATKENSVWHTEQVGYGGYGSSVALDSQDRPHVVYVDNEENGQLIYAYWDGNSWQSKPVQPAEAGLNLSLALDDADGVHIAYGSQYITLGEDGLDRPTSINVVPGSFSSLALDASGRPAISYFQRWGSLLYCQRWDGVEWIKDLVDWGADSGWANSLDLDNIGEPHLSYYSSAENGGGAIQHAYRSGGAWFTETITTTYVPTYPDSEYDTSLALDSQDRAHVSFWYSEYYSDGLYYGYQSGETWQKEMIADDADGPNDLALDQSDRPHVAFVDNHTLKYASRVAGVWAIDDVAGSANNRVIDLSLDDENDPRIVFLDEGDASALLKVAARTGATWEFNDIEVIGTGYWVEGATLVVDAAGKPHVAYVVGHEENGDEEHVLKYATENAGTWLSETVDVREWGIRQPVVVLGNDDRPTIVFLYRAVNLATRSGGIWTVEEAFPMYGGELSAAADGRSLFVSYYDRRGHGLVVAGPAPLTEHIYLPSLLKG